MFYGFGYDSFDAVFALVFLLGVSVIVVAVIKSVSEWQKNNNSPRLTVEAVVVDRKKEVQHEQHANAGDVTGAHGYHMTTSVTYFVTFQVESGDQMKFTVKGSEYKTLQEGMHGKLSFQGSRYIGFENESENTK